MISALGSSVEMQVLFCAILLGIVQLLLATLASVLGRGLPWGVGARDEGWPPIGKYGARLERVFKNFLETFPFFLGAVLLAHAMDKSTHNSVLGAQIYLWARLLYVPAYVLGIPVVRTIIWTASLIGILMVMRAIWPGW
ncbi:MAG TPA: MAPEG family protein [Rhizomicrobium sp.]